MAAGTLAIRFAFQLLIKEEGKQKGTIPLLMILSGSCAQHFSSYVIDQNITTHGHIVIQENLGNVEFFLGECYGLNCFPPIRDILKSYVALSGNRILTSGQGKVRSLG